MATNYIQEGKQVYTATDDGLEAGDPFVLGNHQPCVLLTDAESDSPYNATVQTFGIFDLPVEAESGAIDLYDPLFYDSTDEQLNDDGSNAFFGVALEAVGNGETDTIKVLLVGKPYVPASITETELAAEAVTLAKMADLSRGSIISGQTAGDRPTALDAKGDGQILVGDGTDLASVAVSGDITLTNAGVTTLDDGLIKTATVEISNAEIKAINATPIELVAAPGANKMIEFMGATLFHDYGSNALTGDHAMTIGLDDGSVAVAATIAHGDFAHKTADHIFVVQPALAFNDAALDVLNKNLALTAAGDYAGNAGADTVWTVVVSYRVIDLS